MNLKNFKKKTQPRNNIEPYNFKDAFKILKVTNVISYNILEVIIYNNKQYNIWLFKLHEADFLDNKLTFKNKKYIKEKVIEMVLDKYFVYTIKSFNSIIEGTLFLDDNDKDKQVSLNTTIINLSINLNVLKEKMVRLQNKIQNKIHNKIHNKIQYRIKDSEDYLNQNNNNNNINKTKEKQKNKFKLDTLTESIIINSRITKDLKSWINKLPRLSTIYENDENKDDGNNYNYNKI